MDDRSHPAAPSTAVAHAAALEALPFHDTRDFTDARRGFVAGLPDLIVRDLRDRVVWDMASYEFLDEDQAPDTVHPSLWRQARLNLSHGLFEVADGCYQVRGYDLSNMTIIEGDTGVVVIDPLVSTECAAAAFDLYCTHRGRRPIRALIYTHSHVDHFGGAAGVLDPADAGRIPVIAPEGFLAHAVAENVLVGNAMARRAQYMYGALLPRGPRGQVDAGLGKTVSTGTVSLIPPTVSVTHTGQRIEADGVEMVFQLTPGSEAPAEMNFYFPQRRMLCAAENTSHNMHNIVTLRGALVRDALVWSKYLEETIELFADRTDVLFAQHHWPTWGTGDVGEFLGLQRDLYRYLHDQTVRMLNRGLTGTEIAETFELPEALSAAWHCRGYYGSVSHNVKAVAQRYLGWFDGNPARLHALPPEQSAPGYVELMGGADAVTAAARAAASDGEYRWAAQLLDHVVFAEPDHGDARVLLADVLEQLGYQTENATWRNFYLMGTHELRHGVAEMPPLRATAASALTLDQVFDVLAVRIDGAAAASRRVAMAWNLPDVDERHTVVVERGALHVEHGHADPDADASITLERSVLDGVLTGRLPFPDALEQGKIVIGGDAGVLAWFFGLLETSTPDFPIVTP
ncbi:MAG TPA: alkyl sulfatase dimerization domain-containing protein [Acidimicrobiia bacterium]|nr:alkyl sulfatase dimerization domain-containing protein [Acidimicrobiia bacterium]